MKKGNKKVWIALIVLVVIAALLLGLYFRQTRGLVTKGSKSITVNVDHLEGKDKTFKIRTDAEYLREALESADLIQGSESEYGLWVQTVDGETADDAKQEWWGYDVNGQFAEFGVDAQPVADGDVFDFKLNVGW